MKDHLNKCGVASKVETMVGELFQLELGFLECCFFLSGYICDISSLFIIRESSEFLNAREQTNLTCIFSNLLFS